MYRFGMSGQRVTVVSIDGVAPRFITPETMPNLCGLARDGASCFTASTVFPSITLPAHTSMLRGVDPSVHGVVDNTQVNLSDEWPSFLYAARKAGLTTAALLNWSPVANIVEPDALDTRYFLNSGYGANDDDRIANAAAGVLGERPDVAFAYLVSPDLAGHDFGWGSPEYLDALKRSDRALGRLLATIEDSAVIVTTDHGGCGNDHQRIRPEDVETFFIVKAAGVAPSSHLRTASILDVAPTVAALAGFDPPLKWSGRSLVDSQVALTDHLLELVGSMSNHFYGERLNMAEHSLQTAATAAEAGANAELVIAALLHDVGHLMGEIGAWGFPDHAREGARHLQAILPAGVVEPIRLHVDAKRYLVATDPTYAAQLSEASTASLAEQGGPFTAAECDQFAGLPWAGEAIALRRFDDLGKTPGQRVHDIAHYRPLLKNVLATAPLSARWMRDSCQCTDCRDPFSGQHLLAASDLAGWTRIGHRTIRHEDGRIHEVQLAEDNTPELARRHWGRDHQIVSHPVGGDLGALVADLCQFGIALGHGLATNEGSVLEFARRLGFVRRTNYGELFDVVSVPDPHNLAYSSLGLPLHTDNPYRDPTPTAQILHCLSPASSGGSSLFSDGFAAAEAMRTEEPEAFELLRTTAVDFRFVDSTVHLHHRAPLISVDVTGDISSVRLNHRSMLAPAPAVAEAFYDAYEMFCELVERRAIELELAAGDVVLFDNRRVLHARTAFETTTRRHLQGCYIDIDAVLSTARILTAQG